MKLLLAMLLLAGCQGSNKAGAMAGSMPACLFICVASQHITETATTGDLTGRTEVVQPEPLPPTGGNG